ncbi:hypothetical protein L21TH_2633 [Caldisalinibacter kiritimatiensis]|uniref:Uncharacterized protein n=2 Tax=Caldisalinibacter kiritimatiensis TaxID=1304284 RepID=R1CKY5_9FIRM|nr:hypothetical protein L21TH_2633 [Caldisalinibacter kiritimatiensis]
MDFFYGLLLGEMLSDEDVGAGLASIVIIPIIFVLIFKFFSWLEDLGKYLPYFIAGVVFMTIIIPIVRYRLDKSSSVLGEGFIKFLLMINFALCFTTMYNIAADYDIRLLSSFTEWLLEDVSSINFFFAVLIFILNLVLLPLSFIVDVFVVPMFTIPLIQNIIWKIFNQRYRNKNKAYS